MEENKLFLILVGTFVAGVGSVLIAGFLTLTLFSKLGDNFLSLAAGTLLATAFLSLLPEAFRQEQNSSFLMGWLLLGLVIFFILSKVNLYHHGHEHNQSYDKEIQLKESYGSNVGKSWPILIIGDAVHAFGDGVLIASAFFAGTNIGIMATLSVLIHEIPHHVADIAVVRERSKSNVKAMKKNGAEVIPVYSGSQTLVDAVSECMRYWVANCDKVAMCVGSTVGPAVFVRICGWSTSQISRELKTQLVDEFGSIPKKLKLYNCVGGGSSSFGFWNEFMDYDKKQCEFIGVEAGGPAKSKKHAAPLTYGSKIGILHGAAQYVNQNTDGQIEETESISAGLDYPGISPLHCFLKDTKRARYTAASDEEALNAYKVVTKFEKLRPSLEPSHAFSVAIAESKRFSKDTIVVVNSCGDAYKDRGIIEKRLGKKYV